MKGKVLLACGLTVFCLLPLHALNDKQTKVNATLGGEHDIGYLYDIELVNTTTRVDITLADEFVWLDDCLRPYQYEWIDAPIWYNPPAPGGSGGGSPGTLNNGDDPAVITHRVKQYYYYATSTMPKIVGRTMMQNTPSSLINAIEYLEYLADQFNVSDEKNAILSYIRTINKNYYEKIHNFGPFQIDLWKLSAGPVNETFINQVNSLFGIGMPIRGYFASFISGTDYNSDIHGTCPTIYLSYNYKFYSGQETIAEVDLIHMIASLDSVFLGSGQISLPSGFDWIIDNDTVKSLTSWAGDLQTEARIIIKDSVGTITDFENDVLYGSDSYFSYLDFYADVDAINIGKGVNLSNITSLSSCIYNYYTSPTFLANRVSSFCFNILDLHNYTSLSLNNLIDLFYNMLALDSNGYNIFNNTSLSHKIKYHLLSSGITLSPTNENDRKFLAQAFAYYLWIIIQNE